jgi:hypothetical protein
MQGKNRAEAQLAIAQWGQNPDKTYPIEYKIDRNPDWKVFLNMGRLSSR